MEGNRKIITREFLLKSMHQTIDYTHEFDGVSVFIKCDNIIELSKVMPESRKNNHTCFVFYGCNSDPNFWSKNVVDYVVDRFNDAFPNNKKVKYFNFDGDTIIYSYHIKNPKIKLIKDEVSKPLISINGTRHPNNKIPEVI